MTPQITPEGAVVPPGQTLSANDLHYLRSIYGQLNDTLKFIRRKHDFGIMLGIEILADNLDWLDCFIEQHSRGEA